MYIQKVIIENIRSISYFEMEFPNPAGWHVLIGDNGTGKSSIVRSISATLIGYEQIAAVLPVWSEWLSKGKDEGSITLDIVYHQNIDKYGKGQPPKQNIANCFYLQRTSRGVQLSTNANVSKMPPTNYNWGNNAGWFSVGYGPFRRLTGGDNKWNKVFYAAPKAGAHLSVFGEDIALTEALDWLKDLDRRRLKEKESNGISLKEDDTSYYSQSDKIFHLLKKFINESKLLPYNAYFDSVDVEGDLVFVDGKKNLTKLTQMSDGFRSILSLTFELIRQLVNVYGADATFANIEKGQMFIDLYGVVIIDEIDAHLHPTWQTRIGQWFTQYFPNIQFIVTTHSPLICRACEKGSIWRLAAPDSEIPSGEIVGTERDRLIYGNILDAYGTEAFGQSPVRSEKSNEKLQRLGELNMRAAFGKITAEEEKERQTLQQIFQTDVTIE